jgi:hypothetical protein
MLEASIAIDSGADEELERLVARHKTAKARNGDPRPTGETDRTGELRDRHGWAWLRLFRRYDAYEAALEQLRETDSTEDDARERLPVG